MIGMAWLSGCSVSHWSNLKIEATALIDGRPVVASTIWRERLIGVFPPDAGARSELRGLALAVPVTSHTYVYGTFLQTVNGYNSTSFPDGILDLYNTDVHKHDRLDPPPDNRVEERDYAVRKLGGQKVEICLQGGSNIAPRDRCPIFAYFLDRTKPDSIRQVLPGHVSRIAGHSFVITSVTMNFVADSTPQTTRLDMLPGWLRKPKRRFFGAIDTEVGHSKYRTEDFMQGKVDE